MSAYSDLYPRRIQSNAIWIERRKIWFSKFKFRNPDIPTSRQFIAFFEYANIYNYRGFTLIELVSLFPSFAESRVLRNKMNTQEKIGFLPGSKISLSGKDLRRSDLANLRNGKMIFVMRTDGFLMWTYPFKPCPMFLPPRCGDWQTAQS